MLETQDMSPALEAAQVAQAPVTNEPLGPVALALDMSWTRSQGQV
jgi:hypothetical protein